MTGRLTLGIIRFNVTFTLGIKAVVLALAFMSVAGLWLAILADTGAALLAISDPVRLPRRQPLA